MKITLRKSLKEKKSKKWNLLCWQETSEYQEVFVDYSPHPKSTSHSQKALIQQNKDETLLFAGKRTRKLQEKQMKIFY